MPNELIIIEAKFLPKFNLAFLQNSVPVLLELALLNSSEQTLDNLTLTLTSTPAFVKPKIWHIEAISPQQKIDINERDIQLDNAMLLGLNEAESVHISLSLVSNENIVAKFDGALELLPRNQWGGISCMPEMIAAYVQPNDIEIEHILKKAASILRAHNKEASLNGYIGGSAKAWEMSSAIWGAIGSLGLDYALPPASFEQAGQKIRTPSQIRETGLATCLDSTLLICAAMEQCGLNPVIIVTSGHSFAGVWLKDEEFSSVIVDDITAIRKRIKLKELLVFETTLLTQRPCPTFSKAIEQGEKQLSEGEEDKFEMVVDIRRARMQRIKPLSSLNGKVNESLIKEVENFEPIFDEAPELPDDEILHSENILSNPANRLEMWQRKLLDLSLRNNLLNFRTNKRMVRLDAPNPGKLEDSLADGNTIRIKPRPDLMSGSDLRDKTIYESRELEDIHKAHALDALQRNEVFVSIEAEELESRLTELYRTARATLSEGGSNTLFLAVGFLSWTKNEKDNKRYRAPLILIPVVLNRRSIREGFSLSLHDDEARFNPTLVQMLRQDFGLELPIDQRELPKDEHGLDIEGIWRQVSHAIKEIKGWEVSEEVILSTFSFAKYLMWKDLVDRTEQLRQSPVVRHLIETPRDPYHNSVTFLDPKRLDDDFIPEQTFCPLPVDSSQLSAVMAAAKGKDFVLIGPPGTGKSQTIANIIAQCLAEKKTVLFVSEKIAALNVVYRRLRDVGLGDFCLELHSNKARKLDVLQQLNRAWDAKGDVDTEEWKKEAQKLKILRDELNQFVRHLHNAYPNNLTPYCAIGKILTGEHFPKLGLQWSSPDTQNIEKLEQLRALADRLDINAREVGGIKDSPLNIIAHDEWSPSWQEQIIDTGTILISKINQLELATDAYLKALGFLTPNFESRIRNGLLLLAQTLPQAAGYDRRFVLHPEAGRMIDDLDKGVQYIRQYRNIFDCLSVPYRADIGKIAVDELSEEWNKAEQSFWPMGWFKKRSIYGRLSVHIQNKSKPDVAIDLPKIKELQLLASNIDDLSGLSHKTATLWNGLNTQLDEVEDVRAFYKTISEAMLSLANDTETISTIKNALERLLGDGNVLLSVNGSVAIAGANYLNALNEFNDAFGCFVSIAGISAVEIIEKSEDNLAKLAELCSGALSMKQKLRIWCGWRKVRQEAIAVGLEPLVFGIEQGVVNLGEVCDTFETDYCRWWLNGIVDNDAILRTFIAAEHEKRIADFKLVDERFTNLTSKYIHALLCADLPEQEAVKKTSELGILRREMQKKRAHKPLRELIGSMPTTITKLTPCLLMSPLSIAQYLSTDIAMFDVVVFDEASQIPVWDAIGAIARGKQLIMVGDPKQLPPTSFFNRASTTEEDDMDEDIEVDLESILDECLGANLPSLNLSWHYRSRHESLIAFSNHHYYGGELVTFPSPVTNDRAVSLHFVKNGVYEKGSTRTNKPEAIALVDELVLRLRDNKLQNSKLTIGVVTFNSEQQRLIEDLLDEARRNNPDIEVYFEEDALEPIFVKNLESVQGDERDIMYFSIGYGPDIKGSLSMNFGPMNKSGGERRLNVAITRARHELRIFSSLKSEQIDLRRTQSSGVHDLKHFLEFAEHGSRSMFEANHNFINTNDGEFEKAVANALEEKGWNVHLKIGVSSFRVDIGVVDPDSPSEYIAGIECDGATYNRASTARDRDKLRENVLKELGWNIIRIWSADWWVDRTGSLEKLHSRLERILEEKRTKTTIL